MTITIPTGDLTGILADTIPFALTEKDLPQLNAVRLEWDGDTLHALTTDRYRVGWSQWNPDDEPDGEAQDDLFTTWGGADQPWTLTLALDDAKELVSVYKLGAKEQRVPLTLDVHNGQVKVVRTKETGHSAITTTMQDTLAEFPDVRKLLAEADVVEPVKALSFNPRFLADFAKVRPRGPMELTFTGPDRLVHVAIAKRFIGAIMPTRVGDEHD